MTDASFAQGLVGVTLDGRYRLDAVLGEGGMGSVFRATQLAMDRKVAVKLLKPHLTSDEAALQRFAREARATLKVDSAHAVKVLDFGVTRLRDYYMVLEYLDGRTVHRELEIDGPFAPARVAHVARQALHALGAAHAQGLIHRDVKPDNLLLMRVGGDPDYTKILDFGVAKLMQGSAGDPSQLALTAAGMVFGTPEFMSPEQACGQTLDGRSDLYSLAATMFVMLTGTTLFEGKTAIELLTHHARTPAPHLAMARPELAAYPELDQLLQRCLAKHRTQRPDSAATMAALIGEIEPTLGRAPAARPPVAVPTPPTPPPVIHTSSYFQALRDTDPAEAAASPPDRAGASASTPLSASLPRVGKRRRRRSRWALWIGGVAIASLFGLAFGLAMRGSSSRSPSMSESIRAAGDSPSRAAPPGGTTGAGTTGAGMTGAGTAGAGTAGAGTAGAGTAGAGTAGAGTGGAGTTGAGTAGAGTTGAGTAGAGTDGAGTVGARTGGAATGGAGSAGAGNGGAGTTGAGTAGAAGGVATRGGSRTSSAPLPRGVGPLADAELASSEGVSPRPSPARRAAAGEHLRAAELAFRAGNHLRQIAEADLALHADPRNVRARYLVGDGLIKTGDLDRGCGYLRALKRNPEARDRTRAAGCPGD